MEGSRESRRAAAREARERHETPKPTARLKSTDVKYLALEGGGGKGITYLGAIETLEELKILPINKPAGTNQIRGLAGASAGAITAFALALGYTSKDLRELLADSAQFTAFFDGPNPGLYRVISGSNELKADFDPGVSAGVVNTRLNDLGITTSTALSALAALLAGDDPISTKLRSDIKNYLYNALYDRGLFPGFAVPDFFMTLLRGYVKNLPKSQRAAAGIEGDGGELTFEQFYKLTKLDLVITGVNVTTKRVGVWSPFATPKFPVAYATSISMNVPVLFKPIRIDEFVVGTAPRYAGLWVDGGVLNNFPLHAFDERTDNPRRSSTPGFSSLHPNVLGLRLTGGFPSSALSAEPPDPLQESQTSVLTSYLEQVMEVLTSPAEEGQIRSPDERNQIVELFTGALQLTDFAPPESKWEWPVKNARETVAAYFAQQKK